MPLRLLWNVSVWQWDETCPAEGKVIDNSWIVIDATMGTIVDIGDGVNLFPEQDYIERIDGNRYLVLPGLMDAHIHVAATGESNNFLNLSACKSIESLCIALSTHAQKNPVETLPWIQGVNWDQTDLGRFPTRHDLDMVCPDRPVFLWRACWHIGVANSAALILCGVMPAKPIPAIPLIQAPEGGLIELDQSGCCTGMLKETAVELVTALMTKGCTKSQQKNFILQGLSRCLSFGLTCVQTNDEGCYEAYKALEKDAALPIRVFFTPTFDDCMSEGIVPRIPSCYSQPLTAASIPPHSVASRSFASHSSMLAIQRLKIFSDGSLGAGTAALRTFANDSERKTSAVGAGNATNIANSMSALDPNEPSNECSTRLSSMAYSGMVIHSPANLTQRITEAKGVGFRVEIHAIGDHAAAIVLDSMAESGIEPSDRAVLTHCQVLGTDLIDKMSRLGCIANIQPSFVPTDMRWVLDRLQGEQLRYSYCWRTLMQAGVVVAGGSDAPIESPNPFEGIYDAIFRESRDSPTRAPHTPSTSPSISNIPTPDPAHIFHPHETLTFSQALWMYTVNAAYATNTEHCLGRIQRSFAADLVLVDREIEHNWRLLLGCRPLMVFVGGHVVEGVGGEGNLMQGDYIPGKAGCPCCRPWRQAAQKARRLKNEDRWEAALQETGMSGVSSSEEVFCVVSRKGTRGRTPRARMK